MFTTAAPQYRQSTMYELTIPCKLAVWWLGYDSTCLLRLVSSLGCGLDACNSYPLQHGHCQCRL
ncbi:hypothetical protein GOP47_0012453 [Adiantum capillus-veneris]|uniref:Uncharacterized protein n=1 Tax=Adiantum capillus-veneris TaxID=13818 RepID=A0A9D4UR80_ADICA|nr:hypothetical protein GOP47_0012453 [Adiantum capillus-veneris]